MLSNKKIYPYLILVACFGLIAITFGLANIQGLFFDSISSELNIGKGTTSFYVTLIHVSGALFATFGLKLRNRLSIRNVLLINGILVLGALIYIPRATSIWQIYVCAFLIGIGQAAYGHTMVVELINRWFNKTSMALGIAMCASGVFGSLFSPIIVNRIVNMGWREAYYIFAIIVGIVLTYCFIVIEDKPQEIIQTTKKKFKSRIFEKETLFVASFYIFTASMTSIGSYLLGFSTDIGLSMIQGATLSSVISVGNIISKLIFGGLCDRIGGFKTSLIAYASISVGSVILVLCPANMYPLLIVGTLLLGASFAGSNVLTFSICRDMFGKDEVGVYYSSITSLSIISAFSSTVIGYVYDFTGSYKYSIIGFEILIGVALLLVNKAFNIRKR